MSPIPCTGGENLRSQSRGTVRLLRLSALADGALQADRGRDEFIPQVPVVVLAGTTDSAGLGWTS